MTVPTRALIGTVNPAISGADLTGKQVTLRPYRSILAEDGTVLVPAEETPITLDATGIPDGLTIVCSDADATATVPYRVRELFGDFREGYVTPLTSPDPFDLFAQDYDAYVLPDVPTPLATQAALEDETTRAEAAEGDLQSQVTGLTDDLATEQAAREQVATDLATESAARIAADTALAFSVTTETTRAENVEAGLLPKSGGTMTGQLDMGGQPVIDAAAATTDAALTTRGQVNSLINTAIAALEGGDVADTIQALRDLINSDESTLTALLASVAGKLDKAQNLADLTSPSTARTNLGLGDAATHAASDFDTPAARATAVTNATTTAAADATSKANAAQAAALAGSQPLGKAGPLGVYKPNGFGSYWQAKRAAAGAAKASVAIIGDSIGLGISTSQLDVKSWAALLATDLQTIGDGGSGFCTIGRCTSSGTFGAGSIAAGDLWATSAGWSLFTSTGQYDGPGATTLKSTNASGSAQTLTSPTVRGRTIKLYYLTNAGLGTFTYSIDGGAVTGSVNTAGAAGIGVTTIDALTNGNHTVAISVAAGQASVFIQGASAENSTGVVVNRFCRSGAGAAMFQRPAAPSFGASPDWSGGVSYPADLLIYELGVNDAHASIAPDTYLQNVASALYAIRDGASARDGHLEIVLLAPHIGTYDTAQPSLLWPQYMTRLRGIAEHFGAAFVNVGAIYRNSYAYAQASSYFGDGTSSGNPGSNTVHPGDAGHQLIKNALVAAVPELVS